MPGRSACSTDLAPADTKKPAFPRDLIGQAAVEIARRYAQSLKVEPRIAATLAALVRLGHVAGDDGRFTLRRAA